MIARARGVVSRDDTCSLRDDASRTVRDLHSRLMQRATRNARATFPPRSAMKDGRQMSNYARRVLLQVLIDFIIIASLTGRRHSPYPRRVGKKLVSPRQKFLRCSLIVYVTLVRHASSFAFANVNEE